MIRAHSSPSHRERRPGSSGISLFQVLVDQVFILISQEDAQWQVVGSASLMTGGKNWITSVHQSSPIAAIETGCSAKKARSSSVKMAVVSSRFCSNVPVLGHLIDEFLGSQSLAQTSPEKLA